MRFVRLAALALCSLSAPALAASLPPGVSLVSAEPSPVFSYEGPVQDQAPARAGDVTGTWAAVLTVEEVTTIESRVSFAPFPHFGGFFRAAMGQTVKGEETKYFTPFLGAELVFIVLPVGDVNFACPATFENGNVLRANCSGGGKQATLVLTKMNDEHPFQFKVVEMTISARPQKLEGELHFMSPQTTTLKTAIGWATGSAQRFMPVQSKFNNAEGGQGIGSVARLTDALADPTKAFLPFYMSRLDNASPGQAVSTWVETAKVLSEAPFIARFDNMERGIHVVIGEPESSMSAD